MVNTVPGFPHLLHAHRSQVEAATGRCDLLPGQKVIGGRCCLLVLGFSLQVNGLFPGDGLNTGNIPCGVVGIVVKLPLPCARAGCPLKAVCFQLGAGCIVGLLVKEDLQSVVGLVGFHTPAVKLPAHKGFFFMLL